MIRSLKIMLFTVFFLYGSSCFSQVTVAGDGLKIAEISNNTTSDGTKVAVEDQDKDSGKQEKKGENKKGSVKQVKSARPDMSKSRGARPPDIVRPSGSRIPKGVGRPAGAGRRGRG